MTRAQLQDAKLIKANLSEAIFEKANLSGANLSGAKLLGADFARAALSGADLSNAEISNEIEPPRRSGFAPPTVRKSNRTSFNDATYNDKTIWPDGIDPSEYGAKKDA